jgi:hypothetical protein
MCEQMHQSVMPNQPYNFGPGSMLQNPVLFSNFCFRGSADRYERFILARLLLLI